MSSTAKSSSKSGKGVDSFADLMSFAGATSSRSSNDALAGLSLKERQEKLKLEQEKKVQERRAAQQMWASGLDSLGASSSTPSLSSTLSFTSLAPSPAITPAPRTASSTPVPPAALPSLKVKQTPNLSTISLPSSIASLPVASGSSSSASPLDFDFSISQPAPVQSNSLDESSNDIDDIFAVFNKPPPPSAPVPAPVNEPVSPPSITVEKPAPKRHVGHASDLNDQSPSTNFNSRRERENFDMDEDDYEAPQRFSPKKANKNSKSEKLDHAIAELVDMGFTAEQSAEALKFTDDGINVRQAIDYIMTEAHRKATGKPPIDPHEYRQHRAESSSGGNSRSDTPDISKLAQEFSSQLFSASKILFNQSKKTINKAINSYTAGPADDGTPAWMRSSDRYRQHSHYDEDLEEPVLRPSRKTWDEDAPEVDISNMHLGNGNRPKKISPPTVTDEALALESDGSRRTNRSSKAAAASPPPQSIRRSASPPPMAPRPRRANPPVSRTQRFKDEFSDDDAGSGAATPSTTVTRSSPKLDNISAPSSARASPVPSLSRAQQFKMNGSAKDEDDVMAYVSPARRNRQAKPSPSSRSSTPSNDKPFVSTIPPKPTVPPREPVAISSIALDMVSTARQSGTEAFKRGDYPQAEIFYTQSLASIPPKHLLRTIVLSNRAAAYMKLGDSKAALNDAKEGLDIIGPGLGADEEAEPGKPLKEIWSKLTQRQAEALESLERFKDSLGSWNNLIENGYSSKTALDGKRRCLAALEPPKPKPATAPKPAATAAPVRPKPTPSKPSTSSAPSDEALKRIREANQKAEQEDVERYQLLDSVEQRIESWRKGKEDNLRGLLASLDTVLWSELGWKKVSMAELVIPKKVKISYMKAVAKTHPDKVPANATTEQKMVAQAVFVTINKAWDGFKVANGLS
ncbi:uncharacterized protein SAPINGB_P005981 [Magnusiomyces paraingens]|uniref:UBA domain-containing protein n=1 Tax=Magnusiomyces paraingens TaxID=2606893 RepID=A0A5E8C7U4_9ASCO|nr:uncharacterized protein SAPINGB_P005981 [Saprochaete ingens]VVT57988.1 unnamed protein product [Saprochaete ingens]